MTLIYSPAMVDKTVWNYEFDTKYIKMPLVKRFHNICQKFKSPNTL